MRILFYFSHPAQFHFSKYAIEDLKRKNNVVDLVAKTKDVLIKLLEEKGWSYINIQIKERKHSKYSIAISLVKRNIKLFKLCWNNRYNLLIGTDASLAHVGFVLKIPVITILEDDYKVIKSLARLTFPFTKHILAPYVCNVGKWEKKKIGYHGYMKLAYLHPKRFINGNKNLVKYSSPYFLIRLSDLHAHHDFGIKGISDKYLDIIIDKLRKKGQVYISSEKELPSKYQKYTLKAAASEIHHVLNGAEMLICDSQSMAVEAAMLGTPSIRINSFSGKISVLEELEKKYNLTYGFKPANINQALSKIDQLLMFPEFKSVFISRKNKMLNEKIDVSGFLIWLIENYPHSLKQLSESPIHKKPFISGVKKNRPPVYSLTE
jgi:predicted glycosyltransferase